MWFSDFINALIEELGGFLRDNFGLESPSAKLYRELRIYYGAREIDRETFFRLRALLQQGYYIEGELKNYHRQATRRMELEGRSPQSALTGEYRRILDQVYYNRAIIEEARYQVQQALAVIAENHRWLTEKAREPQAELATEHRDIPVTGSALATALSDEDSARIFGIKPVKIKNVPIRAGGINEHLAMLSARMEAGKRELKRLDALEEQLRLYEAELMVAQSREFLLTVEANVKRQIQ